MEQWALLLPSSRITLRSILRFLRQSSPCTGTFSPAGTNSRILWYIFHTTTGRWLVGGCEENTGGSISKGSTKLTIIILSKSKENVKNVSFNLLYQIRLQPHFFITETRSHIRGSQERSLLHTNILGGGETNIQSIIFNRSKDQRNYRS